MTTRKVIGILFAKIRHGALQGSDDRKSQGLGFMYRGDTMPVGCEDGVTHKDEACMSKPSIAEGSKELFAELYAEIPEIRGILLATVEGLPLVYDFKEEQSAERVAALAASAWGIGNRITPLLGTEQVRELSASGPGGRFHLYAAGASAVLSILTPKSINTGMLQLKASEVAQRFEAILA